MSDLVFFVMGDPAPQGSKRIVRRGKAPKPGQPDTRAVGLIEQVKRVKPWREAVHVAAVAARKGQPPLDGPLEMRVTFWLPRPKGLSKRNAMLGPFRKPDLSKLVRSTEDALVTARAVADDARFVQIIARKEFIPVGGFRGAHIEIARVLWA